MKTRCINLKDHEVRGLLDGSITALWRPVKTDFPDCPPVGMGMYHPYRIDKHGESYPAPEVYGMWGDDWDIPAPYQPGDALIGREAWAHGDSFWPDKKWKNAFKPGEGHTWVDYAATVREDSPDHKDWAPEEWPQFRSPVTMPQWASRIRRELVAVECIQGKDRPIESAISEWEAERETWFWKLTLKSE